MNVKTYSGPTMAHVLAQVRRELGANAVILHTRTYSTGGLLGLGARTVVEVTAADGAEVGRQRRRQQLIDAARQSSLAGKLPPRRSALPVEPESSAQVPTAGDLIRRTYAAARATSTSPKGGGREGGHAAYGVADSLENVAQNARLAGDAAPLAPRTAALPAPPRREGQQHAAHLAGLVDAIARPQAVAPVQPQPVNVPAEQLAEEMAVVKRMVAKMMRQQRHKAQESRGKRSAAGAPATAQLDLPEKLFDQYMALLKQEVAEELAEEVVQQVRGQLEPAQWSDDTAVRVAVRDAVAKLIPTDASAGALQPTQDGRPRVIALIGPTGVGKTTTIAKLAATFRLKQKKKVGLITLDTYRIAAVEQLRTYANILGVPLHVATSVDELVDALNKCGDCDGVLIDTAGRSQRDDPKLEQLASFIAAANPHEVHLVLASTCTQSVLMETIARFDKVRTDRIIFTKLDEAVSFGVLLNVARRVNKRLSYVTTGQEVPHQIEAGRSERLAQLVLGESEGT